MKIAYETLGCKVNQYETESIRYKLEKSGYETVDTSEEFDLCIINTCIVTSVAEGKSRNIIRKAKRNNQNAKIWVTGCYSHIKSEEMISLLEIDKIFSNEEKISIANAVKKNFPIKDYTENIIPKLRLRTRAFIKIQDGCDQFCSYCIIPYARNLYYAKPLSDTIEEIKKLVDSQYKEIVLTGIRLGSYRQDNLNLSYLIEKILEKTEIDRIRLSSIEMWETDKDLINLFSNERIAKHLHIPLQSGNNKILNLMNRPYKIEEYLELIENIREKVPNIGITSDVIVGFPNETDFDFETSLSNIKKANFSRMHIFKYSKRQGTQGFFMENQIDMEIKKKRFKELSILGKELHEKFAKNQVGTKEKILIERKKSDGYFYGYTSNYLEAKISSNFNIEKNQIINSDIISYESDFLNAKPSVL